ncbi:hypothetical protein U8335_23445 [Roseiconus lacunae]|uniref:hypothetical protein n=1 Tax=Roseiconus lacunae TaxID=2605694 RepID=UPI003091B604|nr:hypothetical protein U8335_23445 [Stieleria sp. HD01]
MHHLFTAKTPAARRHRSRRRRRNLLEQLENRHLMAVLYNADFSEPVSIDHPGNTIDLASTMDAGSYLQETAPSGSTPQTDAFGRIGLGDGSLGPQTAPLLRASVAGGGDADAIYANANFNSPAQAGTYGEAMDLFPREQNFQWGSLTYDDSTYTGSGVEVLPVTDIDLSEFWKADANRSSGNPSAQPTVISDISDHALGLWMFDSEGDIVFGALDSADSVTFTDGVLTSIDVSISTSIRFVDLTSNIISFDGTLSISGGDISYQINDTELINLASVDLSTWIVDLTGNVLAVDEFTPNNLETSPQVGANFSLSYPNVPASDSTRNFVETDPNAGINGMLESEDFGGEHELRSDPIDVSGATIVDIEWIAGTVGLNSFGDSGEFFEWFYEFDNNGRVTQQTTADGSLNLLLDDIPTGGASSLVVGVRANVEGEGTGFDLESITVHDNVAGVALSGEQFRDAPLDLEASEDSSIDNLDNFWVTLQSKPTHDVTVTFTPSNVFRGVVVSDSFFATQFYSTFDLTFTPENWLIPQQLVVRSVDDLFVEGTHSGIVDWVTSSTDAAYSGTLSGDATVKLFDNDTDGDLLVINEFVNNHDGTDTDEFVELINLNDAGLGPTYATFHLLQIDGDGADQGQIDSITTINPGVAIGDYVTFNFNDEVEDGSSTWILVEGLDPSITVGDDLDTNNDGALDTPYPYTTVNGLPRDAVGVDDGDAGDAVYAVTVLDPNFDAEHPGSGSVVGGASRVPDGFASSFGDLTASIYDDRFGWDYGDFGSINAKWDQFTDPQGTPGNSPDASDFGSGENSVLIQNAGSAFLTSGQNIYSFAEPTDFDVTIDTSDLSGSFTRIVVQWKTLGNTIDNNSINIDGVTPVYTQTQNSLISAHGGSAFSTDLMAVFDFQSAPDASYDLAFTAAGSSMSLETVQIDAFAQDTAFPAPAPYSPWVRNNPLGLPNPGSDVIPGFAENTNDATNIQIPGLLIGESGGSTDVSEADSTIDSYEIYIGTDPTSDVTVDITSDTQLEIAVDTDEDGDFTDENFGAVASILFDVISGGTSRTIFVRAIDDVATEANPHTGIITHTATSSDPNYNGSVAFPKVLDNQFGTAGDTVHVSIEDNDGDSISPTVTDIKIAGSTWSSVGPLFDFLGAIDPEAGEGYSLTSNSSRVLPWTNLDTILINFSEDIVSFDVTNFSLGGVPVSFPPVGGPVGDYQLADLISNVSYDPTTFQASITLSSPFQGDKLLFSLFASSILDAAGNPLDGDADGVGGDDLVTPFEVLPGDAAGGGSVNSSDVNEVLAASGQIAGFSPFNVFADLDGSGAVNSSDFGAALAASGTLLPLNNPTAPPQLASSDSLSHSGSLQSTSTGDDEDEAEWAELVDTLFDSLAS